MDIAPRALRSRIFWIAQIALVVAIAGLAFEPAWRDQLWLDDIPVVGSLKAQASLAGWAREALESWSPGEYVEHNWRPFARATLVLQKAWLTASGSDAIWPYYIFNVAAHAAVCALLLIAALRWGMDRRAALLGVLIFAAHPIHAEAIHQIVGRTELLAAFWMLAGLLLWMRWGPRSAHALWQQPLIFALALGCKEHVVLYPVYLAIAALAGPPAGASSEPPARTLAERIRRSGATLSRTVALGALLGIVLVVFLILKGIQTHGLTVAPDLVLVRENVLAFFPAMKRMAGAFGGLGYALTHLVAPVSLVPDYSAHSLPYGRGWQWPMAWAGLASTLALAGYAIANFRGGGRGWALAAGGFAGWFLTSNLLFVIGPSPEARLWYWPSAAACLGLGWLAVSAIDRLGERISRRAIPLATAAAAILLLRVAWIDADQWLSPLTAAKATLAVYPQSWRGHSGLAYEDFYSKDYASGAREAQYAVQLIPEDGYGHFLLGSNLLYLGGRDVEAEAALKRSLELGPRYGAAYYDLAMLYHRQGRPQEARAILADGAREGLTDSRAAAGILAGRYDGAYPAPIRR